MGILNAGRFGNTGRKLGAENQEVRGQRWLART